MQKRSERETEKENGKEERKRNGSGTEKLEEYDPMLGLINLSIEIVLLRAIPTMIWQLGAST